MIWLELYFLYEKRWRVEWNKNEELYNNLSREVEECPSL